MKQNSSFSTLIFIIIFGVGAIVAYAMNEVAGNLVAGGVGFGAFLLALVASWAVRVADQWDRAVILRLGQFHALKGPGLFFIFPVIDAIPYWIDTRVITTGFKAEKTLTKDTVPVDVDAVLFWKVVDPKKAALDVADYQITAVSARHRSHDQQYPWKLPITPRRFGGSGNHQGLRSLPDRVSQPETGLQRFPGRSENGANPCRRLRSWGS